MPVASTKGRSTKSKNATPSKSRGWQKKLPIISVVIAVVGMAAFFMVWGGTMRDKADMQDYLRDKYGQEFNIKDIKTRGSGLGMPGLRVGTAYPINDSTLTFEVGRSKTTGSYFDGYSGAVWAREERPRVESFLKTIYSSPVPDFDLTTHIPTAVEPNPIRGEVPPIDEALTRYKDNFYYAISMKLLTDHELSEKELEEHRDKMRKIISFMLSKDVSYPHFRYAINFDKEEKSYLCNLSQEDLTNTSDINSCLEQNAGKAW